MKKITGRPQPFGTVVEGTKVNFALRVPAGKECELLLYREGKTRPECTFDMPEDEGIGEVRFLAVDGIDAGKVVNTATVTGDAPDGSEVSDDDAVTTTIEYAPSIEIIKDVDKTQLTGDDLFCDTR